jgi:SAM-dependent methyltransferase
VTPVPPRRRRAWAADNPGNIAIRDEADRVLSRAAAPEIAGDGLLLDVGCGTGWWLERLAQRGVAPARLHGVELDEARVGAAAARVPGAAIRHADGRELPWPDGSFAAAFLLLVLSSAGDRAAVAAILHETRRVVRPDGIVLVWEPAVPTPWNRSTRRIGMREIRAGLGGALRSERVTVLPPLARRLGARTAALYPMLSPLRTHRVSASRRSG